MIITDSTAKENANPYETAARRAKSSTSLYENAQEVDLILDMTNTPSSVTRHLIEHMKPYQDAGINDMELAFTVSEFVELVENSQINGDTKYHYYKPGYSRYFTIITEDGTPQAAPLIPTRIKGTQTAVRIMARWEKDRTRNKKVALTVAVEALKELETLANLASNRGNFVPRWNGYLYDIGEAEGWGPEPFNESLRIILESMRGLSRFIARDDAREVMNHIQPGSWELISRAAANIDPDYQAARSWALTKRDKRLLDAIGHYDDTLSRYTALREAAAFANTAEADELKMAIMSARVRGDITEITTTGISPSERTLYPGSAEEPIANAIVKAINNPEGVGQCTWKTKGKTNRVKVVLDKVAQEHLQELDWEYRTPLGIIVLLEALNVAATEVAKGKPGEELIAVTPQNVIEVLTGCLRSKTFNPNTNKTRRTNVAKAIAALGRVDLDLVYHVKNEQDHKKYERLPPSYVPLIRVDQVGPIPNERGNKLTYGFLVRRNPVPLFVNPALIWATETRALNPDKKPDTFYKAIARRMLEKGASVLDFDRERPMKKKGWTPHLEYRFEREALLNFGEVSSNNEKLLLEQPAKSSNSRRGKKQSQTKVDRHLDRVEKAARDVFERGFNLIREKAGKPPIEVHFEHDESSRRKNKPLSAIVVRWPCGEVPPGNWTKWMEYQEKAANERAEMDRLKKEQDRLKKERPADTEAAKKLEQKIALLEAQRTRAQREATHYEQSAQGLR